MMAKVETLEEIRGRLKDMMARQESGIHRDKEVDHVSADALLCDALMLLARGTANEAMGQEIVDLFEAIDRWYA